MRHSIEAQNGCYRFGLRIGGVHGMLNLTKAVPKYRTHTATGQAVVTVGERDHYLGRYGPTRSAGSTNDY